MKTKLLISIFLVLFFLLEIYSVFFSTNFYIRNYCSDIFASAYLYFFIKLISLNRTNLFVLMSTIGISIGVESLQLLNLPRPTGIHQNILFDLFIGSTFDSIDLAMYGLGIIIAATLDFNLIPRIRSRYFNLLY